MASLYYWLIFAIGFLLLGAVVTRFIIPLLLRKSQSNFRFSSISPRSIRGLFIRRGNLTITVERVGFSFHSPTSSSARHVHIQIQGLAVSVTETPVTKPIKPPQSTRRTARSRYSVTNFDIAPPLAAMAGFLPSRFLWSVDALLRPIISRIFVAFMRTVIHVLPSLTQILDFEMDEATITLDALMGAYISIKGVTLITKAEFSQVTAGTVSPKEVAIIDERIKRRKRFYRMTAGWKDRFLDSSTRVWARAWSSTKGSTSLALKVEEFMLYNGPPPTRKLKSRAPSTASIFAVRPRPQTPSAWSFVSTPEYMDTNDIANGALIAMPTAARMKISLRFTPVSLETHSLSTSVSIPALEISTNGLLLLKEKLDQLHPNIPPPPAEPVRKIFSPSLISSPSNSSINDVRTVPTHRRRLTRGSMSVPNEFATTSIENILRILESVEFKISSIKLSHSIDCPLTAETTTYSTVIQGLFAKTHLSLPSENEMHRRWLGQATKPNSKLDADVLSLSCGMSTLVVHRLSGGRHSPSSFFPLVRVGLSGLDLIATQWLPVWLPKAQRMSDDHNAAFVACELRIERVRLSERVDLLRQTLSLLSSTRDGQNIEVESMSAVTKSIPSRKLPRIVFDGVLKDTRLQLLHVDSSLAVDPFAFDLVVPYAEAHLSTSFIDRSFSLEDDTSILLNNATVATVPIRMDYDAALHVSPCSARLSFTPRDESEDEDTGEEDDGDSWENPFMGSSPAVTPRISSATSSLPDDPTAEPILWTGSFEVNANGCGLGRLDPNSQITFASTDFVTEIKIRLDEAVVDLRKPAMLPAISTIASSLNSGAPMTVLKSTSPLDRLPTGLSVYFWIGAMRLGMTERDINPKLEENSPVFRGVALGTTCVFEYCSLIAPHQTPSDKFSKPHFSRAVLSTRQNLEVRQELFPEASALAYSNRDGAGRTALIRVLFHRSRCWTLVSQGSESVDFPELLDQKHFLEGKGNVDRRVVFNVPSMSLRLRINREERLVDIHDSIHVDLESPQLYWRFQLLHMYSLLLVAHHVKSSFARPKVSHHPARSPISISVHASFADVQGLCVFPSNERLHFRSSGLTMDGTVGGNVELKGQSTMVRVPSAQSHLNGKWEELCRLNRWSIIVVLPRDIQSLSASDVKILLSAAGARMRIPYQYVFSELILGVTLMVKALKHLHRDVALLKFGEMGLPLPEGAKILPSVSVRIGHLSLEAADDPFESRLNLIWRTGIDEQRSRLERTFAFDAKVAAIRKAERGKGDLPSRHPAFDWQFSSEHSVEPTEAWRRLQHFASESWVRRFTAAKTEQVRKEEIISRPIKISIPRSHSWTAIDEYPTDNVVPLLRAVFKGVELDVSAPSFSNDSGLMAFMADLGSGLPPSTEFTLLVPVHVKWIADSYQVTARDYPLPIIQLPGSTGSTKAWTFETDLVIGEELGPPDSVMFMPCDITDPSDASELPAFTILIPKTVMPVKTYANPLITVATTKVTDFSWGVSFTPIIPDIMRVVDNLTPPQRDPSAALGFWDKLRLIFHWRLRAEFLGDVHIHLKGTRDPYILGGPGAGFVMEWKGRPEFTIGHTPEARELVQLQSDRMLLTIPDLRRFNDAAAIGNPETSEDPHNTDDHATDHSARSGRGKVVAKFNNGIRMGLGFAFQRDIAGSRSFQFLPHYKIALRGIHPADGNGNADSFSGFRSDRIHFSISLASAVRPSGHHEMRNNIFHLSPKAFAHFWSWWGLFNSALALPIRQGLLFPGGKPPSPRFSRFLTTIKYRITLAPLLITHIYHQESREGWKEGQTTCVGVKLMMDQLHADLHQREQVAVVADRVSGQTKITRHKPFHSAEVVLTGSELRAVRAVFAEPQKALFPIPSNDEELRTTPLPTSEPELLNSPWVDMDDFVEIDWTPTDDSPTIWMIPCGFCPRFTYLKRTPDQDRHENTSIDEDTHDCLQGMEDSVHEIQIQFARDRLDKLQDEHDRITAEMREGRRTSSSSSSNSDASATFTSARLVGRAADVSKRIHLLEDYIRQLRVAQAETISRHQKRHTAHSIHAEQSYYMPIDDSSPFEQWGEFSNVYQVHCPKIILSNTTRDILLDYYYSSRYRRGFEYHMATRAVRFIREQARNDHPVEHAATARNVRKAASRVAGKAFRRIMIGDQGSKRPSVHQAFRDADRDSASFEDPRKGWSDDVVIRKRHFCLMLKPQISLRSEIDTEANLIAVASTASLQNFAILDSLHLDDAIHGVIMQRNYVKLGGLQIFAPNSPERFDHLRTSDDVPLEVMVDYRCEHGGFTRVLPQTDGTMQYDKFNRLRLRTGSTATSTANAHDISDHLRNQIDRITVAIPRFSVAARSHHYGAIYNVISNLLLYHDPTQKRHNEALEKFGYLYDFHDRQSAADVVADMQRHLRQLQQVAQGYDLHFDNLDDNGKLDLLSIKSQIFALTKELNLTFEAISHAQAKIDNAGGTDAFAMRLEASSSDVSWNMLDESGGLLAKLTIRGLRYSWLTRSNGSMGNSLTIDDLQALNGSPHALFSEMLVKHESPDNEDAPFVEVDWSALPAVGGISIIESFSLRLHPVRLQIERRTGRRIMAYVFARSEAELNSRPDAIESLSSQSGSRTSAPRASMDSAAPSGASSSASQRPHYFVRSASHQNLRAAGAGSSSQTQPARKLRKSPSSDQLRSAKSRMMDKSNGRGMVKAVDADVEEMRSRASRNRTFLHISVSSLVCVLSYKRDTPMTLTTVPDLDNFKFRTPEFEYHNQIWSFEEAVDAMKKDFYREVWRQKGVLLRELALKAKFVTPRKFMNANNSSDLTIESGSATSVESGRLPQRRKWPNLFLPNRSNSIDPNIPDESKKIEDPDSPIVSSPTSENFPSASITSPIEDSTVRAGENHRVRKRSLFGPKRSHTTFS